MFGLLKKKLYYWLVYEPPTTETLPFDFNRLKMEIRPGDVLLIEGRSRVSRIINRITLSPWTHAALYIGNTADFEDEAMQKLVSKFIDTSSSTRLIIEDILDKGTIVSPLNDYRHHHLRICRPIGLTHTDTKAVIHYAIRALGQPYNVRHLIDLARFLLPWSILPRRWGSSLFRTSTGEPESGICSSLIAEAFSSVQFPVLPYVKPNEKGVEMFQRNPYLFTPKDFDYSPYFEIIKYPLFNPGESLPYYRRFPWTKTDYQHQDHGVLMPLRKTEKKDKKNKDKDDQDDKGPSNT